MMYFLSAAFANTQISRKGTTARIFRMVQVSYEVES
jgi:hypothetical protein